jgi:hypothetical protein
MTETGTGTIGEISFETSPQVDTEELAAFYERQSHPTTDDRSKLERMIERTFCFVTARRAGRLIGLARGITDGLRGYLAECKLDPTYQGPACVTRVEGRIEHDSGGIAREMALRVVRSLEEYGVERIHVLAYGTEVDFCEELGFKRVSGMVPLQMVRGGDARPPATVAEKE